MPEPEAGILAVEYDAYGGPEVLRLRRIAAPQPAPEEVVVKVHAASVNPVDWKVRSGLLQKFFPITFPAITGRDAAGEVVAVGSGADPGPVEERARKSGESSRQILESNLRVPLRRYLAYGYRDLSDADLKHVLGFLQSTAGKHYNSAYIASLIAGFNAMGRRCGEQLGESLRELAQAQLATESNQHDPVPDTKSHK